MNGNHVLGRMRAMSMRILLIVGGLLLAGCGRDPASPRLDVVDPPSVDSEYDEWLKQQLMLRVTYVEANGTRHEEIEDDPYFLRTHVYVSCMNLLAGAPPSTTCMGGPYQDVRSNLCRARTFLAMSTAQSDPVELDVSDGPFAAETVLIDRVTDANAAVLANLGAEEARYALHLALGALKSPTTSCRANGLWVAGANSGRAISQDLAAAAVQAYYLARSSIDRAVEATLSVSDAARSSTLSPSQRVKRSYLGPSLSRAGAAHLLVGGSNGLLGSTNEGGYCIGPDLTPQAMSALQLLRDAAPWPVPFRANTSCAVPQDGCIQEILNDPTFPYGSVGQRLGAYYQIPQLTAGQPVESYYNLDTKDFLQAQAYLQQEMSVFERTPSMQLATPGVSDNLRRFAGAAGASVREPPTGAWAARARYYKAATDWWYVPSQATWEIAPVGIPDRARPGLDTLIAATHIAIRNLLKSTDHFSTTAGTLPTQSSKEVLGTLATILGAEEYKGTVELVVSPTVLKGFAHGYKAEDKVRVVWSEDGLRCAVQGNVEGASCEDAAGQVAPLGPCGGGPNSETLACYTVLTLTGTTTSTLFGTTNYTGAAAGRSLAAMWMDLLTNPLGKRRLYFVRLKDPTLPEKPGNFELLAGMNIMAGTNLSHATPVVPSVEERVVPILAPNKNNCALPKVSCLGIEMDARLPLEDELTDDGNGFESSWKHYLDLARQAADESDFLGREFRDAKLNKLQGDALAEQRREEQLRAAENAMQAVQAACGTAIDSRRVLEKLSSGPELKLDSTILDGVSGTSSSNCVGEIVNGRCVIPLTQVLKGEPDAERLQACLDTGPASVAKFVTLGDLPLCVYYNASAASQVCPSDLLGSGFECPSVKPQLVDGEPAPSGCPTAPNGTRLFEAIPLGYFKNENPPASANACQLLRQLRNSHKKSDFKRLQQTNVFDVYRMASNVGRLGFEASFGGHFTITEDGAARWSSGNITQGLTTGWPTSVPSDCSGQSGLFCSSLPSSPTPAQRGAMTARVLEAVLGAEGAVGLRRSANDGITITYPQLEGGSSACQAVSVVYKGTSPISLCMDVLPMSDDDPTPRIETTFATWRGSGNELAWVDALGTVKNNTLVLKGPRSSDRAGTRFFTPSIDGDLHDLDAWANLTTHDVYSDGIKFFAHQALLGKVKETAGPGIRLDDADSTALYHLVGDADTFESIGEGRYSMKRSLSSRAILDGLEILCELDRAHGGGDTKPASFTSMGDVEQAGGYLETLAKKINESGSMMVFAEVPRLASNALGDTPPTGAFPALSGDMGEAVSALRSAFIATQNALPTMATALQQMGAEMQSYRSRLEITDASKDIIDLNATSNVLSQLNACAQSTLSPSSWASFGVASMVECLHSAGQIGITLQKGALEKKIEDENLNIARANFVDRMAQLALNLQQAALGLQQAAEGVNAALSRIDGMRKQARLKLAEAIYLASYQSETQVALDKSLGSLADLAQTRYLNALKNAKLMSFYAKRAIEQRLGVNMTSMVEDLPLVDAPATWEGTVCTQGGIAASEQNDFVALYGEGFIGEYVNKLENVVESYRLVNNFHEGKDIAVISLRDDVANVREECVVQSRNLLRSSADLTNTAFWSARDCVPVVFEGTTHATMNCVSAVPTPDYVPSGGTTLVPDLALPGLVRSQSGAPGFILRFGDGKTCSGTAGGCGWKSGSALSQLVPLVPGRYRFSWYTRDTSAAYTNGVKQIIDGTLATDGGIGIVRPAFTIAAGQGPVLVNTTDVMPPSPFVFPQTGSGVRWRRASLEFTVSVAGNYEVGFGVKQGTRPTEAQIVTIGAPMLETMPFDGASTLMPAFQTTDAGGKTELIDCQDTDGSLFRSKHWRSGCMHLCDTGFSANCTTGPEYCYHDFTFGVAQPWIQNGRLFNFSGFARGNFNYRIDSLALNFVGSGIRDCSTTSLPDTCSNAGFVPYSIHHNGPFFIRNHEGGDYQAMLFDGRIEHARGLALERYVTNPIASTDRELLNDYFRTEFAGRPVDGSFVVRVWDEPGVNFSAIQDVQLILNYRYWTPFD